MPAAASFWSMPSINVGYVTLAMKTSENPCNLGQAIEMLGDKLWLFLLVLG